jgi:hypothetical protein
MWEKLISEKQKNGTNMHCNYLETISSKKSKLHRHCSYPYRKHLSQKGLTD